MKKVPKNRYLQKIYFTCCISICKSIIAILHLFYNIFTEGIPSTDAKQLSYKHLLMHALKTLLWTINLNETQPRYTSITLVKDKQNFQKIEYGIANVVCKDGFRPSHIFKIVLFAKLESSFKLDYFCKIFHTRCTTGFLMLHLSDLFFFKI